MTDIYKAAELALDALIWATGSADFGEGGIAREGAMKCLFPAIEALREALAQQGEQQPEERIRLTDGEWPVIELGFGKVEVAEGWQGEAPALIFGRNGTGKIGESTQPDRVHLAGETLAVVTFANVESLDVVAGKLATIKAERFAAAPAAQPIMETYIKEDKTPLTDEQVKEKAMEAFNCYWDADDETLVNKYGHGVYLTRFIDFAKEIERAHGIGGNHG